MNTAAVYRDPVSPPYSQCKASSVWDNNPIGQSHGTGNLDSPQAWSALTNQAGQWWQMDTGSVQAIGAVTTQGRTAHGQYVKGYTVQYSTDGTNWQSVDGGKTFTANTASDYTKVTNAFSKPVYARYLRIVVTSWNNHISMRAGYSPAGIALNPVPLQKHHRLQ